MAAMTKPDFSTKRIAISKASAQMVGIVAGAAFVSVFCLVTSQVVWKQNQYRARVIDAKEQARDTLEKNVETVEKLVSSYKAFDKRDPNILNGVRNGPADNDGSNARIVLDALPSSYDFPAVTSTIEKMLRTQNFKVGKVEGTDEQVDQSGNKEAADPKPYPMLFSFSVTEANYPQIQGLIDSLEKSIRPFKINTLILGGAIDKMDMTIEAETYYQPAQSLKVDKKVVN